MRRSSSYPSPAMSSSLRRSPSIVERVPSMATVPVLAVAVAVTALLVAFAGRYGYHRDELYFLASGRHLAWGYPDNPPLVPFLAHVMDTIAPDSLVALRVPSAVATGLVVLLTALSARELGGRRAAQALAAVSMGVAGVTLGMGHLLSTSTFALLTSTAVVWLVLRVLRTGNTRLFVAVGVIGGLGVLSHWIVAFLLAGLLVAVLLAGPRRLLLSGWLWVGAAVAVAIWLPNLLWQASHDWPQIDMSRAIAAGESGTSASRAMFLPEQLLLVGPLLAPIWVAGLLGLLFGRRFAAFRAVGVAYVVLTVFFLATGGKPYYLAGLLPAMLGAGAQLTVSWLGRGRRALRRTLVATAVVLSAVTAALIALPVVPVADLHETPIVDMNYDAGETVGWPRFTGEIAKAWQAMPASDRAHGIVLTGNYGEAGAVERYADGWGLPAVYSGHNGYGLWGPPPADTMAAVAVGFSRAGLQQWFSSVEQVGAVDNGVDVDNDEQGEPIWVCRGPRASWQQLWPQVRHLG